MIGSDAERGGILGGYERVVARLARARVPKIAVVVRKAYGGGHFALGGRPTHPDLVLAWPTAEMGFMAPATGIRTVHRRRLEEVLENEGKDAHDHARRGAVRRLGQGVRALGGGGAHVPRRRDRPAPHESGRRRRNRLRVGQRPSYQFQTLTREDPMPAGPLAHICSRRRGSRPGARRLAHDPGRARSGPARASRSSSSSGGRPARTSCPPPRS